MQYLCLNTRRAPFDNPAVPGRDPGVDSAGWVSAFLLATAWRPTSPSPASDLYPKGSFGDG